MGSENEQKITQLTAFPRDRNLDTVIILSLLCQPHPFDVMSRKGAALSLTMNNRFHKRSPQPAIKIKSALSKRYCRSERSTAIKSVSNKLLAKNFASTGCQEKLIDVFLREPARCNRSNMNPPPTPYIWAIKNAERNGPSSLVNFLRTYQRKNESSLS